MFVRSIMEAKGAFVATVAPTASLSDAVALLRDHGIGALVVSTGDGQINGIMSERDVVRALATHGMAVMGRPVSSVMTADVATCRAEDTVDSVMQLMTDRRIRHLPLVDEAGKLGGIVSIGDMVKARLRLLEEENRSLVGYIQTG